MGTRWNASLPYRGGGSWGGRAQARSGEGSRNRGFAEVDDSSFAFRGPEEDLFEIRVAGLFGEFLRYLLDSTVDDLAALLENQNMRADFFDQVQQMRADDDGRALARPAENRVFHPPNAERIQAGERFVEINYF